MRTIDMTTSEAQARTKLALARPNTADASRAVVQVVEGSDSIRLGLTLLGRDSVDLLAALRTGRSLADVARAAGTDEDHIRAGLRDLARLLDKIADKAR